MNKPTDWVSSVDVLETSTIMTLVLLLLYLVDGWYHAAPVTALCIIGLTVPSGRRSSMLWFVIACYLASSHFYNWLAIDNHQYLITYWCIALSIAFASDQAQRVLKSNAHWLIGLCFAFAVFWKFLSPNFPSGVFFEHCLLMDPRFASVAEVLGGVTPEMANLNHKARPNEDHTIVLQSTAYIPVLADWMTIWTIAIEAWVAAAFLVPAKWWLGRRRDIPLLIFALTTYILVPVMGFAYVLLYMGIAQVDRSQRRMVAWYVVTFVLVQVYQMPWKRMIEFVGSIRL